MFCDYMESPIGILKITANHNFIKGVELVNAADTPLPNELTEQCRQQLTQYFEQKRTEFSLPLAPNGTAFEKRVWRRICQIPYVSTITYQEAARAAVNKNARRAAGTAVGKNPILLLIPCHRVIGANGHLTGFAAGMDKKRFLLLHEGISLKGMRLASKKDVQPNTL